MIKVKQLIQEIKESANTGANSYQTTQHYTNQEQTTITVGFDEVVFNDVVFLLDGGQTEISINRNIMTQRSPYFRSLIKSLDLTKVLQLYKANNTLVNSNIASQVESQGNIQQAMSMLIQQSLDFVQRILWLADFFQILDLQRFLINEVIMPKMTPIQALNYYNDILKKLKNSFQNKNSPNNDPSNQNNQSMINKFISSASMNHNSTSNGSLNMTVMNFKNEMLSIWESFKQSILSFMASNIPSMIKIDKFLDLNASLIDDLMNRYLSQTLHHDKELKLKTDLVQFMIGRIQFGKLFNPKIHSNFYFCIRGIKDIKQLLWEVCFNEENRLIIQEKRSHEFSLFSQYNCQLSAVLEGNTIKVNLIQLKDHKKLMLDNKTNLDTASRYSDASLGKQSISVKNYCGTPQSINRQRYLDYIKHSKPKSISIRNQKFSFSKMMQNYALIVDKKRNRSQQSLKQHSPKGIQTSRYEVKQRANSIKEKAPRKAQSASNTPQNQGKKQMMLQDRDKFDNNQTNGLSIAKQVECFVLKLKINEYETITYPLTMAHNNLEFEQITHLIQQRNIFPTTQPLRLSLNDDDLKISMMEVMADESNIIEIEDKLLQLINWDKVSTQVLLSVTKKDHVLQSSIPFKQKCKYQLRMRKEQSYNVSINSSIGPSKRNSLSKDPNRYSMSFASPRDGGNEKNPSRQINNNLVKKISATQQKHVINISRENDLTKKIVESIVNSPSSKEIMKNKSKSRQNSREKQLNLQSPYQKQKPTNNLIYNEFLHKKEIIIGHSIITQNNKIKLMSSSNRKLRTIEGGTGGSESLNLVNNNNRRQTASTIQSRSKVQNVEATRKKSQNQFQNQKQQIRQPLIIKKNEARAPLEQNVNITNLDISAAETNSLDLSRIFHGMNTTPIGNISNSGTVQSQNNKSSLTQNQIQNNSQLQSNQNLPSSQLSQVNQQASQSKKAQSVSRQSQSVVRRVLEEQHNNTSNQQFQPKFYIDLHELQKQITRGN
ncbi:UNKNOWN [Stylonychia lemnae]|uniref:BTB domain-containing protein n=1 Tax=Stylonychia lemnae TaxID=5949 RepID=A0A077ZMB5_STYLE|nr:UNKNOWN [Stylonychia lemnae]|eukprot:CDW71108.1 UNKNOWN [Stylonychia lemnae]